jgi:hypothetical protein
MIYCSQWANQIGELNCLVMVEVVWISWVFSGILLRTGIECEIYRCSFVRSVRQDFHERSDLTRVCLSDLLGGH